LEEMHSLLQKLSTRFQTIESRINAQPQLTKPAPPKHRGPSRKRDAVAPPASHEQRDEKLERVERVERYETDDSDRAGATGTPYVPAKKGRMLHGIKMMKKVTGPTPRLARTIVSKERDMKDQKEK
tara:strand:- start:5379 stop:5756 length:378 start_codon:yes stop_codon:yes gene_type:complete